MNGQMKRYEKSLKSTPYFDSSKLCKVQIDYHGLIAYAKQKGVAVPDLTDEEKDAFIVNSSMDEIYKMRREAANA